ncbi:leucyl aminopeptidase [Parasphingorhabdus halotolerans]|uniref:Probable cytosol aminopeptidase n=1 Tax=Parasphingorhabdus halotolerans TaxID=2725558 RepID=A0A6H2DQ73_9SPHN|nr:leucyl aminopeptidase [Parasphingorhabdus halotolerans]QJB70540.1 leucyl aminopeptidase [Parasphingorhabdus halotolerans]
MNIKFASKRPAKIDAIAYAIKKDGLDDADIRLEQSELIRTAAKAARFEGKAGEIFETFVSESGETLRVILAGTGKGKSANLEAAGGATVAKILTSGARHLAIDPLDLNKDDLARFMFGAKLRSWRIDKYRTTMPENTKPTLETITVLDTDMESAKAWTDLAAVAEGVSLTRELVSEPANVIYPESFVARCEELKDLGVEFQVLGQEEMEKLGMGALLGVSQGSVRPPRLLAMRWDGTDGKQKTPLALVGKGVTFDTGGISLKPGPGMGDMKFDMGGAGAVAGTMKALASRKAKAHVVGVCGLVENMPDGNAQRPGDIVTSMSGQTIEVLNTDAEGRLVLCDALHWTQEIYKPEVVINLATLTGAIIISLGDQHAGCFCNDDDLAEDLLEAGKKSGDPLWRFPLSSAYDKMINSPIADMQNIGGKGAGSITAAQFLKRFIKDGVKWSHLDIAGMVWADKAGPLWDKGATGFGVRLLNQYIIDHHEQ